jgi:hypothetical protein
MTTTDPRARTRVKIEHRCKAAATEARNASRAINLRDALLAECQGPPAEGKFSYTELAEITGLSRTRVSQIVRDVRRGDNGT